MIKLIIICFVVAFCIFPLVRCITLNFHNVGIYSVQDLYDYVVNRRWLEFNYYGIDMFIGMFGHGKTLSMSHQAEKIYKRFGNKVRFISNYKLNNIPYIPLINFNQLIDIGEEENSDYIGTVVLIDEVENILSHRNFANFPLELLHMLTQQRKKRVYIMSSSQRYFMVDKLFRSITTNVYDCNKYWRFQHMVKYDAWDLENAMNSQLLKPSQNIWWFVHNSDYNAYDTTQMISKGMAEQFISNEESIVRKGLDSMVNENAIRKPKKKVKAKMSK